jgi:Uma2 family endonuclease
MEDTGMAVADQILPPDTPLGLRPEGPGPVRAADFEPWAQEPESPAELIAGWVVPMSPGDLDPGELSVDLAAVLRPLVKERGWRIFHDTRHRLPWPADTVVFPDMTVHCASVVDLVPGTRTVSRVPDLVIELLSKETAERDQAPRGAKFLAYEKCGVREYYYAWPDGREAAGFRREGGVLVPLQADADGYFDSALLGARLRVAPAALRR